MKIDLGGSIEAFLNEDHPYPITLKQKGTNGPCINLTTSSVKLLWDEVQKVLPPAREP